MQELFGSVRRSLVFRTLSTSPDDNGVSGGFVDKIGSTIRKSRIGFFTKSPPLPKLPSSPLAKENVPPVSMDDAPPIRWRKGELIGCGAFGRVYMGMNLDSGELLAVKQVLIAVNGASKDKAQAHIRELEEEVKLLKNLSHPNIVRYLGTAREEEALNILLEFVPGGSIASLLSKFGSFPESVIRMYTKQLLIGLEYLHKNGIMHRDIKGANILVDNKGCIKLADFGASKKVVELATMTAAKSMKGTPYWMAPEVILQTGHTFSADIWSVACTVIEMATGKPPWCQYQEVAALFHIGTTKSPPPIPEHLSEEAKDFLLKCLQKEPHLRASASELLQHPFVIGEYTESQPVRRSVMVNLANQTTTPTTNHESVRSNLTRTISGDLGSMSSSAVFKEKFSRASPLWDTNISDDEMCIIDDIFDFTASQHLSPEKFLSDFNKRFNPVSALNGDLPCKLNDCHELQRSNTALSLRDDCATAAAPCNGETEFTFPCESLADDDEVTELKIRAFLDEKALDLKKLQEGFYNTSKTESPKAFRAMEEDDALSPASDVSKTGSSVSHTKAVPESGSLVEQPLGELTEFKELQKEGFSSSPSFSERQRIWKEELDKELEMERERLAERLRQAGGKISSPNKRVPSQQRRACYESMSVCSSIFGES